ncbi:MAG: sulfatase [Coraliomargaritaceae bacterium]
MRLCPTLFFAAFVFLAGVYNTLQGTEKRPNILWLTSEDNSAHWLGCYGNSHSDTPNLDQLAQDGFQYMHAYANTPVCAPTRSTWITGVLSLSMGTHPMRSFYQIPHDKIRLYPDFLKENGYYTGNWKKRDYNFSGRSGDSIWDNPEETDWSALQSEQPFFQVINFGQSHESSAFKDIENTEHDPRNTTLAEYHPDVPIMRKNYALYHDAIKRMDAAIGSTLAKLDRFGLKDDTIVIYTSDHGGVLPRSKRFLFKNGLHCPLIIYIPDKFKHLWPADQPGAPIDRLVSFVDMPKTWLSITGSEIPDTMQGKIFFGPDAEPEARYHFAFRGRTDEAVDNARAILDKRFVYIRNYMPYVPWLQKLDYLWRMKASQAWLDVVDQNKATEPQERFFLPKKWTEELYDMENDPDNLHNLIDDPKYRRTAKKMRKEMRRQQLDMIDAGLLPETEMLRLAEGHDSTIYELVRDPKAYDVKAILDAADLALQEDPKNKAKLHLLVHHSHVGMRYWGLIGCFLLNDTDGGLIAIHDSSDEIRAMAAWLLVRSGEKKQGLATLTEMIEQRSYAMVSLLNIVVHMGTEAKELIPTIQNLEFKESWHNQYKYEIRLRQQILGEHGISSEEPIESAGF